MKNYASLLLLLRLGHHQQANGLTTTTSPRPLSSVLLSELAPPRGTRRTNRSIRWIMLSSKGPPSFLSLKLANKNVADEDYDDDDNDDDDDGWGDEDIVGNSSTNQEDDKRNAELRELQLLVVQQQPQQQQPRRDQQQARSTSSNKEPERDLFIPIFALVSLAGLFGAYGYEMLRLYSRGELYLPWNK